MPGRKPKPDGQKRNRVPPRVEWTMVPDRPFDNPPPLPKAPPRAKGTKAPTPTRPLGPHGHRLWVDAWADGRAVVADDLEAVLHTCELVDERVELAEVAAGGDWRDRAALRAIDTQVANALARLSLPGPRPPASWPARTRAWWYAVSHMPHTVLWSESDWSFAIDTAVLAATFHAGDMRVAGELRQRERILGTTVDARRDLRIRYVNDDGAELAAEDQVSVTAMDDYRRMVAG